MKQIFLLLLFASLSCTTTLQPALKSEVVRESPVRQLSASAPTAQPETKVVCNSYGLNVRSAAGTQNKVVSVLDDGDIVTLTGRTETPVMTVWYEISKPVHGFISSRYLCDGQ